MRKKINSNSITQQNIIIKNKTAAAVNTAKAVTAAIHIHCFASSGVSYNASILFCCTPTYWRTSLFGCHPEVVTPKNRKVQLNKNKMYST